MASSGSEVIMIRRIEQGIVGQTQKIAFGPSSGKGCWRAQLLVKATHDQKEAMGNAGLDSLWGL